MVYICKAFAYLCERQNERKGWEVADRYDCTGCCFPSPEIVEEGYLV